MNERTPLRNLPRIVPQFHRLRARQEILHVSPVGRRTACASRPVSAIELREHRVHRAADPSLSWSGWRSSDRSFDPQIGAASPPPTAPVTRSFLAGRTRATRRRRAPASCPTNQTSTLSFVVPVFPATGTPSGTAFRACVPAAALRDVAHECLRMMNATRGSEHLLRRRRRPREYGTSRQGRRCAK